MRYAGIIVLLLLALVAGASLGAAAKFGLGYDMQPDSHLTPNDLK